MWTPDGIKTAEPVPTGSPAPSPSSGYGANTGTVVPMGDYTPPSMAEQALGARAGNVILELAREDKPLSQSNVTAAFQKANIPFWVVTPQGQAVNPADVEPSVLYMALVFEKGTLVTYVPANPGALVLGPETVPSDSAVGDSLGDPVADDEVTDASPTPSPSS